MPGLAIEAQRLAHDVTHTAQLLIRHSQIPSGDRWQSRFVQRQVDQIAHRLQWIVDLMRHRCGQPSCRRQLLRSAQQILCRLALLYVRGCAEPVRHLAHCVDERLGPRHHPAIAAIGSPHAVLHLIGALGAKSVHERLGRPLSIVGMNQIHPAKRFIVAARREFRAGEAAPALVHILWLSGSAGHPHHLRNCLEQLRLLR